MTQIKSIHQIVPNMRRGDAIGNTVLKARDYIRSAGYQSEIFCEKCTSDLKNETLPVADYLKYSSEESVVFYHYSIGSELGRFVYNLTDKLILWYHNISPPEHFLEIHNHVVGELYHGRKQLAEFRKRCLFAVGDSKYNCDELVEMGFEKTSVMPLAIDFADYDQPPDPFIMDSFSDQRFNFLFVGRIVPNKGIEDLIKLYAHYKKYVDHDSRLIIVGDWSGFDRYRMQLLKLIDTIDLPHVVMTGRVDYSQLLAYYQLADVYVSLSRHEGFCLPLLEAMYFDTPVMALNRAAVAETMDKAGVLVNELNFAEMAEMLDLMARPGEIRRRIIEGQQERVQRYQDIDFESELKLVLAKALKGVGNGS